jgi:nitroimidazol reductase NimA-like FMN-containing flavoprotein (pyridoxamine 5'-phosphate oxidase superfamily)
MIVHDLDRAECLEFLAAAHVGRLACARSDQPYVVPAFFYFDRDADCLFSFSTIGQKIDWMRENPKVCVEFDNIVDQYHWTTVVVFGRYEEVGDSPEESAARRRAHELWQRHHAWWLPGAAMRASGEEHGTPVVYRIRIDRITGRRAAHPDSP